MVREILEGVQAKSNQKAAENSYLGKSGLLYCSTCHTPKQIKIESPFLEGKEDVFGTLCECEVAKRAEESRAEQEAKKCEQIANCKRFCFASEQLRSWTFERNDNSDMQTTDASKRYVNKFREMKKGNIGVLFYGDFGTGKTFHACNVANALCEERRKVYLTNIVQLIADMQDLGKREAYQKRLEDVELLVIDDLGAERNTSFGLEQLYNIIDTRYRTGLPTIFTTNLSLEEIQNPTDPAYRRIYDRVDEMTPIKLKLTGESKRKGKRDMKRHHALGVLYGE